METKNPIQSAERIFSIIETLSANGPMRLIDLSEVIGLHKSTVHRLLTSLISMDYVAQNEIDNTYFLTFKIVELSGMLLKNTDILSIIHPYAMELSEQCGETVHFVKRIGCEVMYLDKLESASVRSRSVRMASQVGFKRSMYSSAVGKSILAYLPEEEVRAVWDNTNVEKKTQYTITTYDGLLKELEKIRGCGYALDNEENELGIRCIAVAVQDYHDSPQYALSISTLKSLFPDSRISELADCLFETKARLDSVLHH